MNYSLDSRSKTISGWYVRVNRRRAGAALIDVTLEQLVHYSSFVRPAFQRRCAFARPVERGVLAVSGIAILPT